MFKTIKRIEKNNPSDWIITEGEGKSIFSVYKRITLISAAFYLCLSAFSCFAPESTINLRILDYFSEFPQAVIYAIKYNMIILNDAKPTLGDRYAFALIFGILYIFVFFNFIIIYGIFCYKEKLLKLKNFQFNLSIIYTLLIALILSVLFYFKLHNRSNHDVISIWQAVSLSELFIFLNSSALYGIVIAGTYIWISGLKLARYKGEVVDG